MEGTRVNIRVHPSTPIPAFPLKGGRSTERLRGGGLGWGSNENLPAKLNSFLLRLHSKPHLTA